MCVICVCHPTDTPKHTDIILVIVITAICVCVALLVILAAVCKYKSNKTHMFHLHVKSTKKMYTTIDKNCACFCFSVVWQRCHKKRDPGTFEQTGVHLHTDEELEYIRGLVGLGNACYAVR